MAGQLSETIDAMNFVTNVYAAMGRLQFVVNALVKMLAGMATTSPGGW